MHKYITNTKVFGDIVMSYIDTDVCIYIYIFTQLKLITISLPTTEQEIPSPTNIVTLSLVVIANDQVLGLTSDYGRLELILFLILL